MGHWKAAAIDEHLSEILTKIMHIAVINSYPLKRWCKVISVLLGKKQNKPNINGFRTVHIIESDLNYVMRHIWGREMLMWAEKHNAISATQYGGRKGYQAQSASLNKTLTLDVLTYYGEAATIIDNDAQACYDRIIPVVLAYALLRLGLPIYLVRFQINWLEQASYEINVQGEFTQGYKTSEDKYLHGTGQGTGWSPPSWSALSDLISKIMQRHTPGFKIMHPDRSFTERVFYAFVDDVNSGLNQEAYDSFSPNEFATVHKQSSLLAQTQANIQFYSKLLFTTGGKLALHKSYVYVLSMLWKDGYRKYEETHKKLPAFQIKQGFTDSIQEMKLASPKEARRMLGVYTAPDGNSKLQGDILLQKSQQWRANMNKHTLSTFETLMAYNQGILKSFC